MATNNALVELIGVSKEYQGSPTPTSVLTAVDLRVETGDTLAVVGPSGCGKSTLLNLIGTLDRPTAGSIAFAGRNLEELNDTQRCQLRNRSIGFVFQFHHLLPQCSALENVLIPTLINPDIKDPRDRAVALLRRVGLANRIDSRPGQLSGGERQRVAVVRALVNSPSLLLADEPTGSLSQEGADSLTRCILDLNQEVGTALIVVTHSMVLARKMGRVLELRDGSLRPHSGNDEPCDT